MTIHLLQTPKMTTTMKKQLMTIAVALLTAGTLTTSCSSEDNTIDTPQTQQPAGNTITLTATLAPKGDDGGTTRAITTGTDANSKEILNVAWAKDEHIAVYYQKTDDSWATAMATVGTPNGDGSAPFTATLTNAKGGEAKLIYPYSLAQNGELKTGVGSVFRAQDGTIEYISQKLDAATATATIDVNGGTATVTGPVTMQNQVCICKFNFSGISSYDAENYYNITIREKQGSSTTNTYMTTSIAKASMGAVYMALLGADGKDFTFSAQGMNKSSATDLSGTQMNYYETTSTNVTLTAGKFYRNIPVTLNIPNNGTISGPRYSTVAIPAGGTCTLNGATINVSSGPAIWCDGNATIVLTGTNTVTTSAEGQPAIFIPEGKTLTIRGTGSLTATATGDGAAGIGGGYQGGISYAGINCGNIIIESGTITATGNAAGIGGGAYGTCGTITINGGTVTATGGGYAAGIGSGYNGTCGNITISGGNVEATGGDNAAGIGSGYYGTCGDITISSGVTSVEATMGSRAGAPIGKGKNSNGCGSISIDGTTSWTAGTATEHFNWAISTVKDNHNRNVTRWTLTKKMERKELRAVTASEIGWVVGSDGKAYKDKTKLPSGVTARAVIGYYYARVAVAFALEDAKDIQNHTTFTRAEAGDAVTYWGTLYPISGQSWVLGNCDYWRDFLSNNDGNRLITEAGGTAMEGQYWTQYGNESTENGVYIDTSDGVLYSAPRSEKKKARACIGFSTDN